MPCGRRLLVPPVPAQRSRKPIPIFVAPQNESRRRVAATTRRAGQAGRRTRRFRRSISLLPRLQKRVGSCARYFPPVALKKISGCPTETFPLFDFYFTRQISKF